MASGEGYTTIRVRREDRDRLERLAKRLGCKSLGEAFSRILDLAEESLDRTHFDASIVFGSLRYARNVGPTDAGEVDEYLYRGEGLGGDS